mgnify:CR=1 FL=1
MPARLRPNRRNIRGLLVTPEITADLRRRAEKIAHAADNAAGTLGRNQAEHRVETEPGGRRRSRAAVITANFAAMHREATRRSLTSPIDAGRD